MKGAGNCASQGLEGGEECDHEIPDALPGLNNYRFLQGMAP